MSCIPANSRLCTVLKQVESHMEEAPSERRGSRTYQIFPEANMDTDSDYTSYSKEVLYRRERLPSIVVEPSENSELGSGETCWHPQYQTSNDVDKEETSLEGEQQAIERICSVVARKSSIGPSEGQPSTSRLTPPHSPTHPEAAPPCLQNTSSME